MPLPNIVIPHFTHRTTSKTSKTSSEVSQGSKKSAEADYMRELTKIIKICQSNSTKLNELIPIDSEDTQADTYISLIIKSVFTVDKERTQLNGIWVQSVLEIIFDEKHLSSIIDSDV
ncbi:1344_t:CDS:2, partial [Funneliformis geosporum]